MRTWTLLAVALAVALAALAAGAHAGDEAPYVPPSRLLVLGPDGRPLDAALVLKTAGEAEGFALFDPDAAVVARTGGDGFARDLPPEGRTVAWAPGLAAVLVPRGPGAAVVRLTAAESTDGRVRLARGRLAVRVPLLALPLDRAADLGHVVRTDAQGRFKFPALHRGRWRILMQRDARRFQTLGHAEAGDDLGERRPHSETSVTGRLLDGDGTHRQPVAGVGLRFKPLPGGGAPAHALAEVKTEGNGHFRAGDLVPGVYEVILTDPEWVFDHAPPRIQAEDGRAREVPTWFAMRRQSVTGVVLDTEDKPLHGVKLRLVPDPRQAGPPGGGMEEMPLPVESDPKGRFRIQRVTPADGYRLLASMNGFSPWVSAPFPVDRGETTKLKAFRMRKGWRLHVRVRDDGGDPVAGAKVFVTAASRPTAVEDLAWSTMVRAGETGADGLLGLEDLPADDVLVLVRREGFLDAQSAVPYPRVSDDRKVDVDLQRATAMTLHVIAADTGPPPPFTVVATTRDGSVTVAADTDERGKLRLTDLHDTATDFEILGKRNPGSRDHVVLADIDNVVPGVEQHLEIVLPELRTLRGTVAEIDLGGPRPAVIVEARRYVPHKARYVWRAVKQVRLPPGESEASFEVTGLPPGAYAVRGVQGALDSGAVSVLIDQADVGGVELVMPGGARIAGTVLTPGGAPRIGVAVTLTRMHGDDPAPIRGGRPLRASTNERGEFLFEGLAPGLWRLEARDENAAPDVELVRVLDGEVLVTRDLVLAEGGTLEGRIEDGDERPLDGLLVRVRRFDDQDQERTVRTDHEGRYRVANLRPGAFLVRVSGGAVGRKASVEAVTEVQAGRTARVDFTAEQEGVIAGTVRRGGSVLSGALVDLVHDPGSAGGALKRYRTRTDADGTFEVGGLAPGPYRIQLQSGAWRTEQDLDLIEGDRIQLDLEAYEGRLRGKVVTGEGDPVPGAHVTAWPRTPEGAEASTFVGEGRSDPRGEFVLRGLPVGSYTLTVSAPGLPPGRLERVDADLPGADFTVEVVLGRGGDIDLRVTDASDRGITGARVWLEDTEGRALHRHAYVTGAAGRIRINGVPAGKVLLRLYARGMGRPALRTVDILEGHATAVAMTLRPGGTLRLIVTGEGRDPLARARIDLLRAGTREVMASRRPLSPVRLQDPWGYVPRTGVVDIPDLEEGSYVARITAGHGYERTEVPVTVKAGLETTVSVTLAPAGTGR